MLRGVGVVCLLLTSCSAPSERPVDGGADDDASVDCTGDRDSDGVCDEHDVCPDVADPAQVDLDGDHRGWSCDPVETFSFPAIDSGGVYLSPGWISWDAAAALVPTSCLDFPNVCEHALFAVGTTGHVLAHSDSSDPAEDWMKAPRFEGPVVTSDGQILLSRWHGNGGDTVGVDLSSKSAVVRTNSVYESSVVDGQGHPSILQMTQYDLGLRTLVEPRGGNELHVVATTPQSFVVPEVANQRGDRHLADDPYPLLAEKYVSLPRGDHLRSFHPGMDALTELSPVVDGVEQLAPVPTFGYFSPLNMNALPTMRQPWCGYTAADGATLFQSSSSGVERLPVPMTYCFGFTSTMVGDTQLLSGYTDTNHDGNQGFTVAFVRAGIVRPIAVDVPYRLARIYGHDNLVVVVLDPGLVAGNPQVWAILPDNTTRLLSSDLSNVDVSVAGQVVHIVGTDDGTYGYVVRRFRVGSQPISAPAALFSGGYPWIVTTAEGAAIVSNDVTMMVAPSTSLTFGSLNFMGAVTGGARGDKTILFSGANTTSPGGAFAYDEVAGQPRLTRLTALPDNEPFTGVLIDPPVGPPGEYFAFSGGAQPCRIGRLLIGATGEPQLQAIPCTAPANAYGTLGVSRAGDVIAGNNRSGVTPNDLYRLGPNGPELLADTGRIYPIADLSHVPSLIAGWVALGGGTKTSVCLDETPRRCWAVPGAAFPLDISVENAAGPGPARAAVLLLDHDAPNDRITIVRTMGPSGL